jgi:hypothetical protein
MVLDGATQQVLWNTQATFAEVGLTDNRILAKGVKDLLAPTEPTNPAPRPLNKPALMPVQLKNPAKLFIQLAPSPASLDLSAVDTAVSQALLKLGKYQMVDSASEADIVLLLDVEANQATRPMSPLSYMRSEVLDPSSKTILWSFTIAFANGGKILTAQQQINEIIPYFLKAWNGVIGKDHI